MTAAAPSAPAPGPTPLAWTGRTRGGYFGNWFFVQLIRWTGLRGAYLWLVFIAAYFTAANPRAYRCSVDYLRRVLGPQPAWRWPALVYRHFYSFGVTLLDRVAVIMRRTPITCQFEGEELFVEHLQRGRGILLLGAHLGSWEIGGHLLARLGKPVNLVVLERDHERLRQLFDQTLDARQFRVLTTDASPLRSVPIMAALRRGEIVALHGDRSFGGADASVPFLGDPARFPTGPYVLAAVTGAPLFQVFVVRERLRHYRFFTCPPQFVDRAAARQGLSALAPQVQIYANRLAEVCRRYPFQWFNIYPFWDPPLTPASPQSAAAP